MRVEMNDSGAQVERLNLVSFFYPFIDHGLEFLSVDTERGFRERWLKSCRGIMQARPN